MSAPDVIVVGAGIVGVSAAAELARRGARVQVLDREGIAAAASGRNSGAVWQPADPVLDVLYRESLARYRRLADDAAALRLGFRLPERPAGILTLSRDAAAIRALAARWQSTHPWLGAAYIDEDDLRSLEPGLAPGLVACRLDIGYPVGPASATEALAAVAAEHGAAFETPGTVTLTIREGRVRGVETPGRRIDAGVVIVAAGPWTPDLLDPSGGWRPIRPFWGVVVDLELAHPPGHVLEGAGIEEAIDTAEVRAPRRHDATDGIVDFSLVTAAGRSALGSTFLPAEPDPGDYLEALRAGGAAYVPAIADAPVRGLRACARPLSLDGRPLVGAVPGVDGLYVAAGHGPWGISTGPASGAHVAALALGDADAIPAAVRDPLAPGRFPPPPSGAGGSPPVSLR